MSPDDFDKILEEFGTTDQILDENIGRKFLRAFKDQQYEKTKVNPVVYCRYVADGAAVDFQERVVVPLVGDHVRIRGALFEIIGREWDLNTDAYCTISLRKVEP